MSNVSIQERITHLANQGLWFPHSSENIVGSEVGQGTLLDRARGAMIGCAVGDALGTTLEFTQPGTFDPISDIVGGGPFNLQPGEWTDDSSMLLCLAHSLTRSRGFNLQDQIELYVKWWKEGAFRKLLELLRQS